MIRRILVVLLVGFNFCVQGQQISGDSLALPNIMFGCSLTDALQLYPTWTGTLDMRLVDNVMLATEIGVMTNYRPITRFSGQSVRYRVLLGTEYIAIKRRKGFGYMGVYFNVQQAKSVRKRQRNYINYVKIYNETRTIAHYGIKSRIGHTWYSEFFSVSLAYDYDLGIARDYSKHAFENTNYFEYPIKYTFTDKKGWNLYGRGSLHFSFAFPFFIDDFQLIPKRKVKKKVPRQELNPEKRKRKRKRSRRRK